MHDWAGGSSGRAGGVDLCDVKVPRGTVLAIPIATLHCDEEVWGVDAGGFNPLRARGRASSKTWRCWRRRRC